jgi:nucleoside-diphosphate-sugar epimerase
VAPTLKVLDEDLARRLSDAALEAATTASDPPMPAVLNCGSGAGTSFNDLIALLNATLGLHRAARHVAEPPGYLARVVLDIDATRAALGWRPRPIQAGLAAYLASGELR